MPNSLINASNLHVGGGVQVAVSFLQELSGMPDMARGLSVLVSTEVDKNVRSLGCDTAVFASYKVMDVHGMSLRKTAADRYMDCFDTVFTVFGPLYRWSPPFRSIVGFAQPWILYPTSQAWSLLSLAARLKSRLKFWVQGQFFRRADHLVVELEHAHEGLVRHLDIPPDRISVAYNCLSAVYQTPGLWQDVTVPDVACDIRLGFLGRNYLHKNVSFFADVARHLKDTHGLTARLFVTFTAEEWTACSEDLKSVCVNVGPLTVAQCPNFYAQMDGVFFPSLLECFSATPLEAMAMAKPVFASDLPFNRDVCQNFATYVSPTDAQAAAAAIAGWHANPKGSAPKVGQAHARNFSTPKDRADRYLALLNGP